MNRYLNNLLLLILGVALVSSTLGVYLGINNYKNKVRDRALKMGNRDCYSNQDLEMIIFNEVQE